MKRHLPMVLVAMLFLGQVSAFSAGDPASVPRVSAPPGEILEGTLTYTAHGGGTWRAWFNASGATILCANPQSMWFSKGGCVWRYNIATQQVDVFTSPITHPDINHFQLTGQVASDGRLALSCQAAILLWDGKEWSRLPQPEGNLNPHFVGFDARDILWAIAFDKAYAWDGRAWSLGQDIPQNGGVWPVGDGWFMWNRYVQGKSGRPYSRFSGDFKTSSGYANEADARNFGGRAYPTPTRLVGRFWRSWEGPLILCEIGDTITELVSGDVVVLDLSTGEVLQTERQDAHASVAVKSADNQTVSALPPIPAVPQLDDRDVLLRDANGHYWRQNWRFDGRTWRAMVPPNAFVYDGSTRDALSAGRLQYDRNSQTWIDVWPELPADIKAFDPVKRTGWLVHFPKKTTQPTILEKIEFAADGRRTTLATIESPRNLHGPMVCFEQQDAFWFNGAFRWDGRALRHYDDGWMNHRSDKMGVPQIFAAAGNHVWMYHTLRTWKRYDAEMGDFMDAEPWDEFKFEAGGRKFSIVGNPIDCWWDWKSDLGRIWINRDRTWFPMPNRFTGEQHITRGQGRGPAPLFGVPVRLLRGDRMLVSCLLGVFEWDMKLDRWAFLAPHTNVWAYFDDEGRRLMISNDSIGQIISYDGDPFAPLPTASDLTKLDTTGDRPAEVENDLATSSKGLEATLKRLIENMDSEFWRVREESTRQVINLIRKQPEAVAAALKRLGLREAASAAVKARIHMVLKELSEPEAIKQGQEQDLNYMRRIGNSLLERMHPPMAPEISFVIKPGMNIEHAAAIFIAAGARRSHDIHNAHYPDLSFRGYLLTDGTMTYLRLEGADGMGKVLSIGLGQAGQGNDPWWDWSDAEKNGLRRLDLKPYTARYLD